MPAHISHTCCLRCLSIGPTAAVLFNTQHACRLLKRELNKQERASDAGVKSVAMGMLPFKLKDDLRAQLQAFASGGEIDWIEMVRFVLHSMACRALVMPRSPVVLPV